MRKPTRKGATGVIMRIPIELNNLLEQYHQVYVSKVNDGQPVPRAHTDRIFAHEAGSIIMNNQQMGKITITPRDLTGRSKPRSKAFDINWDIRL